MKHKMHLHINDIQGYLKGDFNFCFTLSNIGDMTIAGWVYAGEVEIKINIDRDTLTAEALDQIDKVEEKYLEEHRAKLAVLAQTRQELLCLEDQS
jgi:hypothetical protein